MRRYTHVSPSWEKQGRCYNCWKFGHMAKWCKESARCGRCAAAAHEGGETACPSNTGRVPLRCSACGGNHTVWDRQCKEASRRWDMAREAYAQRPLRFAIHGRQDTHTELSRPMTILPAARPESERHAGGDAGTD